MRGLGWLTNVYINNPVTLAVLEFQRLLGGCKRWGYSDDLAFRMGIASVIGVFVL